MLQKIYFKPVVALKVSYGTEKSYRAKPIMLLKKLILISFVFCFSNLILCNEMIGRKPAKEFVAEDDDRFERILEKRSSELKIKAWHKIRYINPEGKETTYLAQAPCPIITLVTSKHIKKRKLEITRNQASKDKSTHTKEYCLNLLV